MFSVPVIATVTKLFTIRPQVQRKVRRGRGDQMEGWREVLSSCFVKILEIFEFSKSILYAFDFFSS